MELLDTLKNNKGTVSSALGKELAQEVLAGNMDILSEAIVLTCYNLDVVKGKVVRAGAAKIVEKVAEKRPELVAEHLEDLLPAFKVAEPQTRWMVMQVFRYCLKLNEKAAKEALSYAKLYIDDKQRNGLCLLGAVDLFLGAYGSLSKSNAQIVFTILKKSADTCIKNEHDWVLEAFTDIVDNLSNQ